MPRRHPLPLPTTWLFSDERLGTGLIALAALLPPGSGIVVRHDSLTRGARARLVRRLMRTARSRNLIILIAATPDVARRLGVDGVHLRQHLGHRAAQAHRRGLIVTMPVHTMGEARTARRVGAAAVFVSPLHPTRSHPEARALGPKHWARIARESRVAAIALGGLTKARARRMRRMRLTAGWAAIDYWQEKAASRRKPSA